MLPLFLTAKERAVVVVEILLASIILFFKF